MEFKEKYTTSELKAKYGDKEKDKIEISMDFYALGDTIESLINKLEQIRIK